MIRDLICRLHVLHRAWRLRLRADPAQTRFILDHLRPGEVAVDVGSHKGGYTYWMRKAVGPGGMVYAFEPQPRSAAYHREVARRLRFKNVLVEEKALSSRRGTASFVCSPGGFDPGGHIAAVTGNGGSIEVELETLDEYFAKKSGPVSLVKIDAEGHELEVFRGAERILEKDRPALVFECERRHHEGESIRPVLDLLLDRGYRGWFILKTRLVDLSEFDEDRHQRHGEWPYVYNFAFTHPDRPTPS